ncbi:hypothetical protein TNCV_1154441 [Trichonephila clavipes]|nr:hypothetical protein TNCV_1154441 [Trichonephila clavipes]
MRAYDIRIQKIYRLQPGSNPQPWTLEAGTLLLSHRVHMPDTKEIEKVYNLLTKGNSLIPKMFRLQTDSSRKIILSRTDDRCENKEHEEHT